MTALLAAKFSSALPKFARLVDNGSPKEPVVMTTNPKLAQWVKDVAALCTPDEIRWCDGSPQEYQSLCHSMVETGAFIPLNPGKRPNSYYCRSDPNDVA